VAAAPTTPSTTPTEGASSSDNSKPGWGHGDKNHDHTGPPGAKDSDQKDSDQKDSDQKRSDQKRSDDQKSSDQKDSDEKESCKKESGKKP
jgi:hypothetical protein